MKMIKRRRFSSTQPKAKTHKPLKGKGAYIRLTKSIKASIGFLNTFLRGIR